MTVLTDILGWSGDRPLWQRDALRRIVSQENLSDQDLETLCRICLAPFDINDPEHPAPDAEPLAAEHLPPTDGAVERVQLLGLREVCGVNALAPNQQMAFEPEGMTVIFGFNGSGKSGYARILRTLCHARNRGDRILPNAFADGDEPVPTAVVDYRVAGLDRSETWQQGQHAPRELQRTSFFDADCAAVHVDEANELAFTPFGLDVLPKLAQVCRQVGEFIAELTREEERRIPTSLVNPQAPEGTEVRRMLDELDENSQIETLKDLADLSEEDRHRITELRESLGSDPSARARETRNAITRLRRLQSTIKSVGDVLSPESVEEARVRLEDAITKRTAATTAAEKAFGGQTLSGVGEPVWQQLWDAARKYSEQHAYPNEEFPVTGDDSRCVLCQQLLAPDAQTRLTTFEAFIKADTQQAAEQAEAELTRQLGGIRELTVGHAAFAEYLPDLAEDQLELKQSIRRFHGIAWRIRRSILQSCSDAQWAAPCALPGTPDTELDALICRMSSRAEELERAAVDADREALVEEKKQLVARQWLGGILVDAQAEIARKKALVNLELARSTTVTTGITRKSGELADTYVTDVLRERLTAEISTLGADYLRVELDSAGGKFGHKRFKIALQGALQNIKVRQVLSEGEFRCIALASFLAELSTEQSCSALILDDPVCSLDHQWRRRVARRLVRLAAERQVIVFTHDIVFLGDLVEASGRHRITLRHCYVHRGPTQPGECLDGLPWSAMRVKDRVGRLKNWCQAAGTMHRREGPDAYEPEARRIYGRMRETWERAVEEVLLHGVVIRFDRAIHTQQLNRLTDITDDDIVRVDEGMTKCSRFLEGHDEAQAVMDPVPDPDELLQDVVNLEAWIGQVRSRRG